MNFKMTMLAACMGSALIGCGGGGDSASNITPTTIPITGTVSAPLANDVTPGSTVADIVTVLKAETQNEEEANNILTSIAADGTITGTVKDSSNTPLANIDIVVHDFSNWITCVRTRTNAAGQYTVRVASGRNYIVGAVNHTLASTAASEWWTAGGRGRQPV